MGFFPFSDFKDDVKSRLYLTYYFSKFLKCKTIIDESGFCTAINETNMSHEENYFIATGKLNCPILINNISSFNCWKLSV